MNILNLNDKIYGTKNLKQGEYANFIIESIEQQEMLNMKLNNNISNISNISNFDNINKEIKF